MHAPATTCFDGDDDADDADDDLAQVFSGSPADGHLQRGDVFVSINNNDVSRMQQKQAEDIIRATGSALSLVIKRSSLSSSLS